MQRSACLCSCSRNESQRIPRPAARRKTRTCERERVGKRKQQTMTLNCVGIRPRRWQRSSEVKPPPGTLEYFFSLVSLNLCGIYFSFLSLELCFALPVDSEAVSFVLFLIPRFSFGISHSLRAQGDQFGHFFFVRNLLIWSLFSGFFF